MPVKPPRFDLPRRFNPVFVTNEDLEDLASFTGMDPEECLARLHAYSAAELADAWRRAAPKSSSEILEFYRSTDLYIWDLMQWHASAERQPYWEALSYFVEHYPPQAGWARVYDFGCGVGTDGLYLASSGYRVTLVDVDGPAFRFARHRLERHGLKATFIASRPPLPEPDALYDAVVCFDVFEHLPDPLEAARRLVGALRPGGLCIQQGTFGDGGDHPCHLAGGVRRFAGLRWHIHLAGLGLKNVSGMLYRRGSTLERAAQRARYTLWLMTRMWLVRVGK